MGLPVICIDARQAKAVLKMQINKSDHNDAVGIARIIQCGWYKEVRVKDLDSHATKALALASPDLVLDARPPAQPHSGVVDDWHRLATKLIDQPIDLVA